MVDWREIDSYGVFVKRGVTPWGEDDWGEPVACFIEERNALEAKRQLEREGHTTSIRPFRITYRDEQEKRTWLADYEG